MKSTLHSTCVMYQSLRQLLQKHTSSKGSERESEIALQFIASAKCFCAILIFFTNTLSLLRVKIINLHSRAFRIIFIQRSTIGQSVFAAFWLVAGYCVILLRCMLCYIFPGRNYSTRLETRTKEFNWIASRRVLLETLLYYLFSIYGVAKAKLCHVTHFMCHCSTG